MTTYWPTFDLLVLVDVLQRDVAGDAAGDDALGAARAATMASTKLCWSVMSVTCAAFASTLVTRPDEALRR